MMDKEEAKNKILAHVLKKYPCYAKGNIVATNCVVEMVIDEYEKLLNEPDDEAWRNENIEKLNAGVKFEKIISSGGWIPYLGTSFADRKDRYREVPEQSTIPHAAERALYWRQRAEGTNEDWQYSNLRQDGWVDVIGEPAWMPHNKYRPKPKTRTVYFALVRYQSCGLLVGLVNDSKEDIVTDSKVSMFKIIGAIEQREVECD